MLSFKMLNNNILEVKETTMSFTKTKVSYWYYNVVEWTDCVNGKNEPPFKKMTPAAIAWVKKYYLSKVGLILDYSHRITYDTYIIGKIK